MQRESHPVLQGIDYKKADATNNVLFYSNLKMLVMQKNRVCFLSHHIYLASLIYYYEGCIPQQSAY
jgi:hypothetical protein